MSRLVGERDVEGDDVGVAEERIEVVVAAREDGGGAERLRQPCRLAADPPRADDQHRLSRQALAEHELEREPPRLAAPHEAVAFGDAAQEREHQRERELRRRAGEDVRRVGDDDAAAPRRLEVDVVHPDGVVGDDPQLRPGRLEIGVVDRHREHRHDAVRADRRRHQLEVGRELRLDLGRHPLGEMDARSHEAHHP